MRIAVIGAGFVGEATGRGFAKHKNEITFVDVDPKKVNSLKAAGFEAYLANDYKEINTNLTMICVPTPTKAKHLQLDILANAIRSFAQRLKSYDKYHVVVIRSTVPPYTTRKRIIPLIEDISGKKVGKDFGVVMQPEYLREATAKEDFERPWFILIGEYDSKSGKVVEKLYKPFNAPIEHCSLEEAEMQKYVHNVYNAVKIAFFNEMRVLIKANGWNTEKIFQATAESSEGLWNPLYGLRDYGPFDGSCLPKDTRALVEWAENNGHSLEILKKVCDENLRHLKLLGRNNQVNISKLIEVES